MVGNYVKLFWIRARKHRLVMGLHFVFIPFCHTYFFSLHLFIHFMANNPSNESFFSTAVYIRNANSNQSPQFSDRHLNMQKVEKRSHGFHFFVSSSSLYFFYFFFFVVVVVVEIPNISMLIEFEVKVACHMHAKSDNNGKCFIRMQNISGIKARQPSMNSNEFQ